MKKLIIVGLLAVFALGCTTPEISDNAFETYGTKKSESITSESDGSEFEHDNSED